MAKLSRQTKEIIKTVLFFAVLGLIGFLYIIYPLNRAKTLMARSDVDNYNADSLAVNEAAAYDSAGLAADTFRYESDGLTNLACLYIATPEDSTASPKGTVILLHDDGANRDSMVTLATAFHESGFVVVAYDQRATGRTTGKYRGEGTLEASDARELISHLEIRNRIIHPLSIVGFGLGGEAALLSVQEEKRIDAVVAVRPYLSTLRMQDVLRERYQTYWFPFYRTIMWWWYEIRSGHAVEYRKTEDIKEPTCRTLVFLPEERLDEDEILRFKELSPANLLRVVQTPTDTNELYNRIIAFVSATPAP